MKDFLQHVLSEVKHNRLPKSDAVDLIRKLQTGNVPQASSFETMAFVESWKQQALKIVSSCKMNTLVCFLSNSANQQIVTQVMQGLNPNVKLIFIAQGTQLQEAFQNIRGEYQEVDGILYLWPLEDTSCVHDFSHIIDILQAISSSQLKTKRMLLAGQYANGLDRCYLESWIGFERSLRMVFPNIEIAAIIQEANEATLHGWIQKLWDELQNFKLQSTLYQNDIRYICQVQPTNIEPGSRTLKDDGTYLITGGCGGLGFLFAEYFAKTRAVNLILTGRSSLNKERHSMIKRLEDLGSKVMYIQADVCDIVNMREGIESAKECFGEIHGIIHAAGLSSDQSILEKDIQEFQKIVNPKIKGTLVLDELFAEDKALDFICYFSSSSAILGDFGSCDYAVGNRFQMAYAEYRKISQYQGKTFVINWPLWLDGGMRLEDKESVKLYLKSSGQQLLEAEEGLMIFDRILSQDRTQHLILLGQRTRVESFLGLEGEKTAIVETPTITHSIGQGRRLEMRGFTLEQCLEWDMKDLISQILKVSCDKLDVETNLADFGFESVSLSEFATSLTQHYGIEISPTLFFGNSTIKSLVQYFGVEYGDVIQRFYQEEVVESVVEATSKQQVARKGRKKTKTKTSTKTSSSAEANNQQSVPEPIAIIGMSGRFPQARNIDELWNILLEGKEVVTEVPADRFDWREMYGDRVDKYNQSNSKWLGAIPGVREFDPLFFEISPREAEEMDPKQRLLIQESWKALEDAGYGANQIRNSKIGMFVGVEEGDYQLLSKGEKSSITSNHNAILSARLPYFLNFNGPVMSVNTACSSGLVAAHQACTSLRNGECDTAIVAGINLLLTPIAYVGMSQAGMLSDNGKCFAFDNRANGLVPGEAVAVVVLKKLSQAQEDGDPIYAVIQGSGLNYDGKTNGITAPSGVAQANLLKEVYERYQVNLEEIEYIVTHGTGTKLGDPVEINALYDVFKNYTKKQGYCALTSPKTNFGHTFAASGLVNLISLVQSMRHEIIPASLHCERENDYINWNKSPFYVNKTNKPWPVREDSVRTGALSSFGMSGTNVHMVVQSYCKDEEETSKDQQDAYHLLAFSAKTEEALQEKVQDMITILEDSENQRQTLSQMSYTLLEGRQHFAYRCAIVIQDYENAVLTLRKIKEQGKAPNLFTGKVPFNFTGQKAMQQYAQDLVSKSSSVKKDWGQYQETLYALADLYCQGYEPPWNLLFSDKKMVRTHLPTYPFAREEYWIEETNGEDYYAQSGISVPILHPLLHQNTSNLSEQRFSSTFTGQEFFLSNHVIKGQQVLSGVAYLEMVRVAIEKATGTTDVRLENVVWAQPFTIGEQSNQIHISLFPESNGKISYEVYSDVEGEVLHSQGCAVLNQQTEAPVLDLEVLQNQCNQNFYSAGQCYEAFQAMGLEYGQAYKGIERVYVGTGQVLAKLALPSGLFDTLNQFKLHPSLMDAALQSAIGFLIDQKLLKLALPFALQEVDILGSCTPNMWARVCYSDGCNLEDKVQKLDIDLCDDQGNVRVRMKGYTARLLEIGKEEEDKAVQELPKTVSASQEEIKTVVLAIEGNFVQEKAVQYFKTMLSSVLKMPVNRIEANAPFEKY
ncbi:type I polyketide synthase, partial [Priestia megaterium]|uniref:type I polyketide synthase n=1 Tax=Priestia megaterium TaxID=1404 RepID=UPI001656A2E3